ncbi:cache domain-containing protein [Leptolyngbya sp. PCC 6406]|uniref:cache domain-containing protein n=1 Tax=Leptolyngbya sp. PCC 6406 TaxID=1173264 RepID=UPI0002AC829C|nr:cache domain-containing protein [Leptolyngbya sp. PCC 6406]
MKLLRKSLLTQLVSSFSLLSLITISLVSYSAYGRARESLQNAVFDRLNVAVALKEFELNQWFINQRQEVSVLARSPVVIDNLTPLLPPQGPLLTSPAEGAPEGVPETPTALGEGEAAVEAEPPTPNQALSQYFTNVLDIKPTIQSIDILTNGGIVVFSTDADQTGVYKGLGNNTTYFEPDQAEVVPTIYLSPITGEPTITLATPILNEAGERQAVLAITLNLDAINQLIRERTGLGKTGETYLVQPLNRGNIFVSGQPLERENSTTVTSFGIDQAMQGINGMDLYDNYAEVPVIGVYKWVAQNNVGLFAELSQEEAFQPAVLLARDIFLIGLGSASILLVLVYVLARYIVRPVLIITDTAARIEEGSYDVAALDTVKTRLDELGQLARVFQGMVEQVYKREQRLKRQVAELTIEIDQSRKERQVAEITETSYFQELSQKAKDLRNQRRAKGEGRSDGV